MTIKKTIAHTVTAENDSSPLITVVQYNEDGLMLFSIEDSENQRLTYNDLSDLADGLSKIANSIRPTDTSRH